MELANDTTIIYDMLSMVRISGRLPKPLVILDNNATRDEYFIEPIIEGEDMETANIFYNLPRKFARQILGRDGRYRLCFPEKLMVQKKSSKKFSNVGVILKSCGIMPKGKALSDEKLEDLMEKRADIEMDEEEKLSNGEVPEHMKNLVVKVKNQNVEEVKKVEKSIASMKDKQAKQAKVQRSASNPNSFITATPDNPNFKYKQEKTNKGMTAI